jgi:hypothetical protein
MAANRSTLSRNGRTLGPLELVSLKNGTVLPAGVYQALSDAYVEMMRQKGVLKADGEIDPSGLLDKGSIRQTQFAGRSEAAAAPRPSSRTLTRPASGPAPSGTGIRPPVPVTELTSFEGRYHRAFGDPSWVQVEVDARAFAAGSGSGGHLGAELGLGITLPGIGRKSALKSEIDVAVLWDICSTRTSIDPIGPDARVASHSSDLCNPSPWQARQGIGRTQLIAFGVPINLWLEMVGIAGVSAQGAARSAFDDPGASKAIMKATLGSTPTAAGENTMEGAYARLWLEGSGQVGLTLRSMVGFLSQYDPKLRGTIAAIVEQIPGLDPWGRVVGEAGAFLTMQLVSMQLRAEGFYRLDYFHDDSNSYVQSGGIDARLSAKVLVDPSIQVFFSLALPERMSVVWENNPTLAESWPRLGDRYDAWGWRGALFDREVSILEQEWQVDFGPGAGHAHRELPMEATNGV